MGCGLLDRFRAAYARNSEALARGDVEAGLGWVTDDFEWHVLEQGVRPDMGIAPTPVLRGREQILAFFSLLAEEWNWRPEAREFTLRDEHTIFVRVVGFSRGRRSGIEGETVFTQTWDLDDRGVPVCVRECLEDWHIAGLGPRSS
jgi:ketosteroid isomerase-like protein